ncbi:MAG: fibronectin type III domain-containing protein, partial [Bacteroidota bacterium]
IGTTVMPASVGGSYDFYVETVLGGCSSAARELVTVNATDVNAILTPANVTCNGGNNGSFTLGTIECGTEPFTYSVNGGAFGAIPTDLTAGTYSVLIEDAVGLQSAPISVVVTQPAAPSNITFTNINYFTADVSWTTTGNETSWTVEYGPAGFTPGSGTSVNTTSTTVTLTDLTEDTQYDVYITADCAPNPETAGPSSFNTNAGFFTWDTNCGPGFNDISGTGAGQDLGDDNEFTFTLPWTWTYQGLSVTNLSVDNNGGISLGGIGVPFGNGQIATAANGLYPMWDDLFSNGGAVYTEVVGTAPNRQAIIQWNVDHIGFDGDDFVFQVVIDEATNEVYYLYDNVVLGSATYDFGANATIGAAGPQTDIQLSFNSPTFLQNNSCVHFYNALCPNATNVVVTPFQEDILLDWEAGAYGETEWTIIYGPAGFDPATEGTTLTGLLSSDATISGLTQLTDYDIYIYSECAADNLTSGGLLVEATTLPWCADPTALNGIAEVDSLFASWNWTAAVGSPSVLSSFNLSYAPFGTDVYSATELVANGLNNNDTIADPDFLGSGVYQVWVQAVCGVDTSNYVGPFTFVMPLSNDTVCGAEMLNVDGTVYYFNNVGATVDGTEPSIMPAVPPGLEGYNGTDLPMMTWGEGFPDGTTWYSFIAPASGSIRFSGQDQNYFASQIAIYEAADCGDYATFELVAASDQTDEALEFKIAPNFTICGLTPGNVYYVMHESWNGLFDQYSIKLTPINLEAGSFVELLDVCSGSEVNLFDGITAYDNGGIWTAEIAAAGTGITDSTFNSSGLAYQVFNFEYRVTDGCAYDSITSQVEIWPPSSAGDDGTVDVCRNEPFDLLSGLNGTVDLGGTWYDPGNTALPSSAITASNIPGQFNYDYVVGNGVCPDDTALVLVNVSSSCNYLDVQEMIFADMTVHPNPSNGVFNITNEGTEVFSFAVTDVEGRVILAKEAAINGTTVTEIDLTGKVTGVYMIRVFNDTAEKVFRVVLQ